MSLEEYQDAWRATSPAAALKSELDSFIGALTRSERRGNIVISICAVNAVVALAITLGMLLFRRPLAWNEALPAIGLQAFVTFALALLMRRRRARRQALKSAGMTVREAARTGLDNVNGEIRDARLMLTFAWIIVPLLAFPVSQLIASGKMNARAALSFALLCALAIGVNAAVQWWRYRRTLAPRRMRLEQILASLQDEV